MSLSDRRDNNIQTLHSARKGLTRSNKFHLPDRQISSIIVRCNNLLGHETIIFKSGKTYVRLQLPTYRESVNKI